MTPRNRTLEAWAILGAGLLLGCGAQAQPKELGASSGLDGGSGASAGGSGASAGGGASACSSPDQGCPCSTEGDTVSCGSVVTRVGDYVTCSQGSRTCASGSWGLCLGATRVETRIVPHGGEFALLASRSGITVDKAVVSTSDGGVCADNPCDPNCNTFVVSGDGYDAGADSGITDTDSGLSLYGNPVPVTACTALQVTPNTAPTKDLVVTSMAPSPNTVQYTASLVPPTCYPATPSYLWSIDQYDIAQISTTGLLTLAVPIAGPITVAAYAGALSASVVCNVTVNVVDTSAAPPTYSNLQFPTTTGAVDSIQVLYPYRGTVFPLGLPPPLIQWQYQNAAAIQGSFGQPALSQGNYLYNPSGAGVPWTYGGSSGVTTSNSGFTSGVAAVPDGGQVAFLQGTGSISQSITTGAGSYTFTWYAIQRQNWGGPNDADFVVDGVVRNHFTPTSPNSWQTFSATVALSAGSHTIAFTGLGSAGGDDTLFLDDMTWTAGGGTGAASAVKVTLRFPSTGTPIFSWAEIVPELQTQPTPSLPGQPRATIPQSVWSDFQETVVRNSGASGGDAVFAIQRYVSGTLMAEVPTTIHFANGQLKGNIFYNSYGTNLVQNFGSTVLGAPFGAATLEVPVNGTSPTVVVGYNDPTYSGAGCRVCHSVASSGSTILSNSYLEFGNSGSGDEATTYTYDPTKGTPALIQGSETLIGSAGSNAFTFAALSPDGTYLFSSASPQSSTSSSRLYTLAGNVIASNLPSNLGAATPVFSPDAAHVAFNFYSGSASPLAPASADGASLAMMDFSPPSTFSNFRVLYTPASLYSVWPSFLPPGQNGVVFENQVTSNGRDWGGTRSNCDGSGSCNNIGATGELWWASTGAVPAATRLTNLNGGSYLPRLPANQHGASTDNSIYYEEVYNYEPTVLPVTIGGYSWVAFTSRRLYGNVATINPFWSDPRFQDISVQPTPKKIWIAAISPNPTPGTDPSFPAFYLPGQELQAGNARAYFALSACEAPGPASAATLCTSNLDCCGGTASPPTAVCQLDPPPLANPPTSHCVSMSASACVADGASCSSDTQCCSFATGSRCGSGKCNPAPPLLLYSSSPFTTTYTASCGTGSAPVWRFFYWEAGTPTGTSIAFKAQTSPDGVQWGSSVAIGTAQPPPTVTPTWTSASQTVDQALRAAGQSSQQQLKVIATLNPDSTRAITPTLTNWQVTYDCASSE
jgi:hypothetical protein